MTRVTKERLLAAYDAAASGDRARILEYWDESLRWETPGHHPYSGWHEGLDAYLAFGDIVAKASGGTWNVEISTILVNAEDGYTIDVSHTTARRAHAPADSRAPHHFLDVDGIHLMKWRDGRIVEGRGVILGDGITNFSQWWSPVNPDGSRTPAA